MIKTPSLAVEVGSVGTVFSTQTGIAKMGITFDGFLGVGIFC